MQIERFLLVWNADGGLRGDLAYAVERLRGRHPCPLCELTHGLVAETSEWKACKRDFRLPIEELYRDRLSREQADAAGGDLPCVLAQTTGGLVKLMGREAIEACEGDLRCFVERLQASVDDR